jgi:hypothetical protein
MWIVRLALNRPYTFIVAAMAILLLFPVVLQRTPTDVLPSIDVPVVSVSWTYSGLSPQQMEDRIVTSFERVITTVVVDIDHIESQTTSGRSIIKCFFRPGADIRLAVSQLTSVSQSVIRSMPPGISPPFIITYSASDVPILQVGMKGQGLSEQELFDYGANLRPHPDVHRPGNRRPVALRRQAAPGFGQRGHPRAASQGPFARRRDQRHRPAESGAALRHRQARSHRIQRGDERLAEHASPRSTTSRSRRRTAPPST